MGREIESRQGIHRWVYVGLWLYFNFYYQIIIYIYNYNYILLPHMRNTIRKLFVKNCLSICIKICGFIQLPIREC
jgi:hypothetical protein